MQVTAKASRFPPRIGLLSIGVGQGLMRYIMQIEILYPFVGGSVTSVVDSESLDYSVTPSPSYPGARGLRLVAFAVSAVHTSVKTAASLISKLIFSLKVLSNPLVSGR